MRPGRALPAPGRPALPPARRAAALTALRPPAAPSTHVDHRHEPGRVRGVPCFNCNSAIGKLGDDPDALRRSFSYLEGNLWKPTLSSPGVCRLPS
ncbi:endonuclease domain-containing protein [Streptomyces sp. NPDC059063]|uniref:endonuclease domain-containing protein n=1 Tax=unclassified Streptomyces TaxID=2593676 RepID=UPI0036951691